VTGEDQTFAGETVDVGRLAHDAMGTFRMLSPEMTRVLSFPLGIVDTPLS
jgi:hypothetical protein